MRGAALFFGIYQEHAIFTGVGTPFLPHITTVVLLLLTGSTLQFDKPLTRSMSRERKKVARTEEAVARNRREEEASENFPIYRPLPHLEMERGKG